MLTKNCTNCGEQCRGIVPKCKTCGVERELLEVTLEGYGIFSVTFRKARQWARVGHCGYILGNGMPGVDGLISAARHFCALWKAQKGKCLISDVPLSLKTQNGCNVDHDPDDPYAIRGLVSGHMNVTLGHFGVVCPDSSQWAYLGAKMHEHVTTDPSRHINEQFHSIKHNNTPTIAPPTATPITVAPTTTPPTTVPPTTALTTQSFTQPKTDSQQATTVQNNARPQKKRRKVEAINPFLNGKNDEDTLLVYPFAGDCRQIEEACILAFRDEMASLDEHLENLDYTRFEAKKDQVQLNRLTITVEDYKLLDNGEAYFNDTLIDFWMQWLLRSKSTNIYCFSTHFFPLLEIYGAEGVENWTSKQGIDIFEKKMIFIPINKSLHWSLCVVVNPMHVVNNLEDEEEGNPDAPAACILFFDSLNIHDKKYVCKEVQEWLNLEWACLKKQRKVVDPFTEASMPLYSPKVPIQSNSWDCGVYVCMYAQRLYAFSKMGDITVREIRSRFSTLVLLFSFCESDIIALRQHLKEFIERLSELYKVYQMEKSSEGNDDPKNKSDASITDIVEVSLVPTTSAVNAMGQAVGNGGGSDVHNNLKDVPNEFIQLVYQLIQVENEITALKKLPSSAAGDGMYNTGGTASGKSTFLRDNARHVFGASAGESRKMPARESVAVDPGTVTSDLLPPAANMPIPPHLMHLMMRMDPLQPVASGSGTLAGSSMFAELSVAASPPAVPSSAPLSTSATNTTSESNESKRKGPKQDHSLIMTKYLTRERTRNVKLFPDKLYQLLVDAEKHGYADVVLFMPCGKRFAVKKADEFISRVASHHFRCKTYKSFKRQLYLYKFVCVNRAVAAETSKMEAQTGASLAPLSKYDVFEHESFVRGQPELLKKVRRK